MGCCSWAGPPFGEFKVDFTGSSLTIIPQIWKMNFNCTNGEICDRNGNLLFSSNGIWVSNAANDTMVNGGRGFNPCYFTNSKDTDGLTIPQANLIIPFPNDTNKYYLFHESDEDYGNSYCTLYLYYSVIDMTLDNGRGAVTQKNVVLLNDSLVPGRLTACKHANGRDWWLVSHQYNSDRYYKYLLTPDSIEGPFIQNIGAIRGITFGQSVFSPDGSRFAYYEPVGDLDVFDFDRCNGDFTFKAHADIDDSSNLGGVAFSPNSNVLYVSSVKYIYQFDMNASDIAGSQMTVATWDGFYSPVSPFASVFYLSEIAPDGKIYVNCGNGTLDIHVINNPDSLGLGSDVCQHCIHFPSFNHFTIANHPNYFLGADSGSVCDSLTGIDDIEFMISGSLKVYPNPITYNEEVTFTYPSIGEKTFLIINSTEGKEVARYELPQWSTVQHLKLPKLVDGVYIARIMNGKFETNTKFVVIE